MRLMPQTDPPLRTAAFEQLVAIRRFEEEVRRLSLAGSMPGAVHLAIGHEAVSVGVGSAIGPDDWVACTYRGHGHALTAGVPQRALMAELLGRATGICGGRSGSMNIVAREYRLLGSFGIIGGSIAAATGAALSLRGTDAAAIAFFGDGAVNQAYFLECLNLAAVLSLPVLFVCENNLYAEYTRTDLVTGGTIADRARAMGVQTEVVDGMDVRAVAEVAGSALPAIRNGAGPRFIETETYRYMPHSRADPVEYQPRGEIEHWKARDPIDQERIRLIDEGIEDDDLSTIVATIDRDVARRDRSRLRRSLPGAVLHPGRGVPVSAELVSIRDALHAALADELALDPSVFLLGEDIAVAGGVFAVTGGLMDRFGPERVIDTPDLRARPGRGRVRRRGHRVSPSRRDHVRRLHGARDGLAGEPGREVRVRLERPG